MPALADPTYARQPESDNVVVWRYMSHEKFVSMLEAHALYFAPLAKLDDKHEGSISQRAYDDQTWLRREHRIDPETRKHALGMINVCCWTRWATESDAFWKIYGKAACDEGRPSRAVAIRSTYALLRDAVSPPEGRQVHLGLVTYSLEGDWANVFIPAFRKRPPFAYEDEVRLAGMFAHSGVYDSPPPYDPDPWISCDLQSLIVQVVVSPYSAPEYFEEIRAVVRDMAPIMVPRVRHSALDTTPLF